MSAMHDDTPAEGAFSGDGALREPARDASRRPREAAPVRVWVLHRSPARRAMLVAMARLRPPPFADSPAGLALDGLPAPDVVVLGLAGDLELELEFAHRAARRPALERAHWILVDDRPHRSDSAPLELRMLFDALDAEVLPNPVDPQTLRSAVERALANAHAHDPLSLRRRRDALAERFTRWLGDLELPELLRAMDPKLCDVPLVVRGESGTGRSLLVRYVHAFGGHPDRHGAAIVEVACETVRRLSDIGDALADAAHEAFATVVLDDLQALEPVVQERLREWVEFGTPAGMPAPLQVRWAATLDERGTLLPALEAALAGLAIHIPPLRERVAAIAPFVRATALHWGRHHGGRAREFAPDAIAALEAQPWPGNLRELEAVVLRTLARQGANPLHAEHLALDGDVGFAVALAAEQMAGDLEELAPPARPFARTLRPTARDAAQREPAPHPPDDELLEPEYLDDTPGSAAPATGGGAGPPAPAPSRASEAPRAPEAPRVPEHETGPAPGAGGPAAERSPAPEPATGGAPHERALTDELLDETFGAGADESPLIELSLDDLSEPWEPPAHGPTGGAASPAGPQGRAAHTGAAPPVAAPAPPPSREAVPPRPDETPGARWPAPEEGALPPAPPLASGAAPEPPASDAAAAAREAAGDAAEASAASSPDESGDDVWRRVLAAAAEQLRQPLSAIRTFSELLPDHHEEPEFLERFEEIVGADLSRIEELIERFELLALAGEGQREPVDLTELLESLLSELREDIARRRLLVLKELDRSQPIGLAHPLQLRFALDALLRRLLAGVEHGGDLYLASSHNPDGLRGAPAVRILVRHAPARSEGGQGVDAQLELAVVAAVVRSAGGSFAVHRSQGGQTVVVIDLPAPL